MKSLYYSSIFNSLHKSNTITKRSYIVVTNDKKVQKYLINHSNSTVRIPLMPFSKCKLYILSKIGVFKVPFCLSDTTKQHSQGVITPNTPHSLPSPLPVRSVALNISYPQHTYNEKSSIYSKNENQTYVTRRRNVQGSKLKRYIINRNKKDVLGLSDNNELRSYEVELVGDRLIMLLNGVSLLW